jgi:signal transduction histidine kinase
LSDGGLSAEHCEYLKQIIKAGKEMLQMINSSHDLFKMETDRYQYNPDVVDLSVVINSVIKDLKALLKSYGAKIHISHQFLPQQLEQAADFMALVEENLCYSLFANLIRNAVEVCASEDTIQIILSYEENHCVISITNPGSIPEQIRDSFFEKYVTSGKKQGLCVFSLMGLTYFEVAKQVLNRNEFAATVRSKVVFLNPNRKINIFRF